MPKSLVLRSDLEGVTTLTLNRPEKLNALNPSLFAEFREHVDAIVNDETVGCVVVTGACLLYTSPSPRDRQKSRMPSSA